MSWSTGQVHRRCSSGKIRTVISCLNIATLARTPPSPSFGPARDPGQNFDARGDQVEAADVDRGPLDSKQVDLLLVVPPDFQERLEHNGRPALLVLYRPVDDHSRQAASQVQGILNGAEKRIKEARLLRQGLPGNYDDPFEIRNPELSRPPEMRMAEGLFEMLVRFFPFMLVMWS